MSQTEHPTTHPKVVAGVVLIASVLLFSLTFTICMGASWIIAPPETVYVGTVRFEPTAEDYFNTARVAWNAIIAAVVTVLFWRFTGSAPD